MSRRLAALAPLAGLLAVGSGIAVLAGGLAAAGYEPGLALGALVRGAFGSGYALVSATLVRAIPLIVIGLGLALAFRAGALNIGAEGQFYAGALAATWAGLHVAGWPQVLAVPAVLVAATVAGLAWMILPVFLKLRFRVLEVISTLLLNFVAEGVVSYAVTGPMQEASRVYPQSDPIVPAARIPVFGDSRLHLGILLALGLAAGLWWVFARTRTGFQLKAVGLGPLAAQVSGRVRVARVTAVALLGSGAFAGLAGGLEVGGVTYALFQNLSPGYGFSAIAVALLARLHPLAVVATGLLFGALEAGAQGMQREAGVPAVTVAVVEAVVIVVVLVADALIRRRPSATAPAAGVMP